MKAVDPHLTFEYVPECDRSLPAGEQTIFVIKPLTPREDRLLDNLLSMQDGAMNLKVGDQAHMALCMGLANVKNLFDGAGKPIEIKHTGRKLHGFVNELADEFIACIPKDVRLELSRVIQDGSKVGEDEAKN